MGTETGDVYLAYGLGGPIFSGGLKHLSAEASRLAFRSHMKLWWMGRSAGRKRRKSSVNGPIVLGGHSAGASFINAFAEEYGGPIDLAIYVDAWLPSMSPPKNIRRSISVQADRFGRFHVSGPGVAKQVVIPDTTHTTIDDSDQLRALFRAELEALL